MPETNMARRSKDYGIEGETPLSELKGWQEIAAFLGVRVLIAQLLGLLRLAHIHSAVLRFQA
jgi:hypothetical protein